MKLETLCRLSGLTLPKDAQAGAQEICAIATHSRACVPGCIYVCISGARADGHTFIEEALAKGAAAVVTEREHPHADGFVQKRSSAIFISCDDTRAAAAKLYHAWYGSPGREMTLVAVTGTNGKTTVTTMLYTLLMSAGIPCGLIGTTGSVVCGKRLDIRSANVMANMTTPDPEELYHILAVMEREGADVVVMEATSHALALRKLEPLTFDIAVYTNLTQDHLDFHGSLEAYWQAKASLLGKSKRIILNVDDATVATLQKKATVPVVTVSAASRDADYAAADAVYYGAQGIGYTLYSTDAMPIPIFCPVPGEFTVSNTLLAISCARQLGVSFESICETLHDFAGVPGRMERVLFDKKELPFSIFIDYAHTPDALEKLLKSVCAFRRAGQRVVALFGCGGDRDRGKRSVMGQIAARYADVIYLTADNSRSEDVTDILADIREGIPETTDCRVFPKRAQAIENAVLLAQEGDILLLIGKGHETYEIDRDGKHPFDERVIAAEAVEKYLQIIKKDDKRDI